MPAGARVSRGLVFNYSASARSHVRYKTYDDDHDWRRRLTRDRGGYTTHRGRAAIGSLSRSACGGRSSGRCCWSSVFYPWFHEGGYREEEQFHTRIAITHVFLTQTHYTSALIVEKRVRDPLVSTLTQASPSISISLSFFLCDLPGDRGSPSIVRFSSIRCVCVCHPVRRDVYRDMCIISRRNEVYHPVVVVVACSQAR